GIQSGVAKKSGGDRGFNRVSPKNLVAAGDSIGCRQKIWWRQGIQSGVAKKSGGGRGFNRVSPKNLAAAGDSAPQGAGCISMALECRRDWMSLVVVFITPTFGRPSAGGEFAGLPFGRSKENNVGTRFSEIKAKTTLGWLVFRKSRRKQLWEMLNLQKT
ncbi:MAG: hypothetical protein LBD45_05430, partial [Bacteroidales bacterium]|nr:hypothetical protein [Bacteroidales bacterium]